MQEMRLTWGAWHGDKPVCLSFPDTWKIKRYENPLPPPLSLAKISDKLLHPTGSSGLSELAKKSKTAAILIDDITRPTPTDILLPRIVNSLKAGGMRRSAITVIIAGGAHQETRAESIVKKTGPALSKDLKIIVHDCEKDLIYLGKTRKQTPVYVNKTYIEADLKIAIGTILPHPIAGFSGGSKIVAPGVCGMTTIRYLHDYTQCYQYNYHRGPGKRFGTPTNIFRREIDEICDMAGLDFLVNVILNQKREVLYVAAGNRQDAFRLGTRVVSDMFCVSPGREDVIVANTYPFDTDMRYMLRGFWPLFDGGRKATKVVIGYGGDGMGVFGSKNISGSLTSRLINRMKQIQIKHIPNEVKIGINILRKMIQRKNLEYLFLCQNIKKTELAAVLPQSICFDRWDDLLAEIERRHPEKSVSVAVYPYAPLQFPVPSPL